MGSCLIVARPGGNSSACKDIVQTIGDRSVSGSAAVSPEQACIGETHEFFFEVASGFQSRPPGRLRLSRGGALVRTTVMTGRHLKQRARSAALAKSVTIERDTFGVPHVYGPTDAACVFGFIYAQAEDYFWQVEDSYLRSLGRAAEVYGEKSLPDDLVNRALEIPALSMEEYKNASPKTREICQATAAGLNHYLAVNPQTRSPG